MDNNKQTNIYNYNYNLPNTSQYSSINFTNKSNVSSDGFRKYLFLIFRKTRLEKFNQ